jgi:hypothetical protein
LSAASPFGAAGALLMLGRLVLGTDEAAGARREVLERGSRRGDHRCRRAARPLRGACKGRRIVAAKHCRRRGAPQDARCVRRDAAGLATSCLRRSIRHAVITGFASGTTVFDVASPITSARVAAGGTDIFLARLSP